MNRTCQSLSPSSVMLLETRPVEFWFRYIAPVRPPRFAQTRPMAFGSAFDGAAKEILAKRQPKVFDVKRFGLKSMIDEGFKTDTELLKICAMLAKAYCEGPPGAHFKKVKPTILEGDPAIVKFGSVPIYGKLDVLDTEPRVWDFKVSGSNSSAYPVVGYQKGWLFDLKSGRFLEPMKPHKWAGTKKGLLEVSKPDWAFQLATYDMIRGNPVDKPGPVGIDQISFVGDGTVKFTQIQCDLSVKFKKSVQRRYAAAWRRVKLGQVLSPELRELPVEMLDLLRGSFMN